MIASVLMLVCVLGDSISAFDGSVTPAETVIINRANATYHDADGTTYDTVSQTITVSILAVPAIVINPDETAPSAVITPNENITRVFRLCNTGNAEDAFLPTRASISAPAAIRNIYFDIDNSGTVTPGDIPVQIGQTPTPRLAAGDCLNVLFAIDTNNVTPQSQVIIGFTARSTSVSPGGGFAQDDGTIINSVGTSAVFTSPGDPALPPLCLVENIPRATAAPGQIVNYTIAFRNAGSVPARDVRVIDDLPAELDYVAGTLRLNGRSMTDAADTDEGTATVRQIAFLIPQVDPDAVMQIQFQARLSITNTSGTGIVNFATLSAAAVSAVNTSNAVVVVDPVGTVYAGNSGGSVRIAGATVSIKTEEAGLPLALVPNAGFAPNLENTNPFATNAGGGYGFTLAAGQIGTPATPVRYVITVTAPNYRPRLIEVMVSPSGQIGFYQAAIRPLDGQAIAEANSFSLTSGTVDIHNLAAMVFNIPMFDISSLEISKNADKPNAEIGDIVSYRIQVKNATASAISSVAVNDYLPRSFVYAAGTAQIEIGTNKRDVEPATNGTSLTFDLGELGAGMSASISYRLRVGAGASEGQYVNSATATGVEPNGQHVTTAPANATVRVRGGVFSMRQVVIGRVFEDRNANGQFDAGERPVAGARIYTNNGQSVITDSAGQYSLPAISEGSIVLSLDPVTLSDSYVLLDENGRRSSRSWTRLLRTPLGGGSLLSQNFAIASLKAENVISDVSKVITAKGAFVPDNKKTKPDSLQKQPVQIASIKKTMSLGLPGKPETSTNSKNETGQTSETYTVESTEKIEPVLPGDLTVLSPGPDNVVLSPALTLKVRTAINWTIEAEVNGEKVDAGSIGETRIDNRNQVTTFSYVGINLRPGPNNVKLTAHGSNREVGKTTEFKVYGRGPVEKLEIVPTKNVVQTGGRDAVDIQIRGLDQWGNPAADGQVSIETSAGEIFVTGSSDAASSGSVGPARQQLVSLKNGIATVQLVGEGTVGVTRLKATAGSREAAAEVRFAAEMRPTLLVGLAEMSFGKSAPEISSTGDNENIRGRLAFYYRGRIFGDNLLTLAYDSQRALNRVAGRDRFGGFDPLDRTYPIFGDSSTRFEDAQSNSKIYARVDRGLSYAMFGDMEADLSRPALSGYGRRLTGVKLHVENTNGDFVTVTGARPDTAFSRDVLPGGGLSLARLSHSDILPGSEVVSIEVRDRRNPEIVLSRENLIRSIDYNLNAQTGEIFFMRQISTFDYLLNLVQVVITYEHRGPSASNYVYTGRAERNFKRFGFRVGASYVDQQQGEVGAFHLGGIDIEKTMPRGGSLNFEAALSNGRFASGVNVFSFYNGDLGPQTNDNTGNEHNGTAVRLKLEQPLPFFQSRLRVDLQRSTSNFYNPFGATIAAGNQRFSAGLEIRPSAKHTLGFGLLDERNSTANVDNSRRTFSFLWSGQWRDNLRTIIGFDNRRFDDKLTDHKVGSNLVTAAVEYRPTSKIELSVKREQNLGEADPTYPDSTTLSAKYQLNQNAKLFFTQRLSSAEIKPIGDLSGTGFASTGSRRETAFGIESKVSRLGILSGKYQLENGISGTDSFAVIGLQNRWSLNKEVSVETGFEHGFLLNGGGKSFSKASFGATWTPSDGFRTAASYELRDRNGFGQLFTVGAAGKIGENWTTMVRGQWTRSEFNNLRGASSALTGAFAYRPLDSDKYALLFSYNQRSTTQAGSKISGIRQAASHDRSDTLSSDGLYHVGRGLELYGRAALRFNGNGTNTSRYASALTFSTQLRVQQRINNYFDLAAEGRLIMQPSSFTRRTSMGAEVGYWAIPDLRFGVGYNFIGVREPMGILPGARKAGFYFTISAKLSKLFDLFGTSGKGLATTDFEPTTVKAKEDPR